MFNCGCCPAEQPSKVIGYLELDREEIEDHLPIGRLNSRFIRNTNVTGVYRQREGTCYAYAASSAYLNTALRIIGKNKFPTMSECFQIAVYSGTDGGDPLKSIEALEKHFHFGISCDRVNSFSINDAITLSLITCFSTSREGWKMVKNGSLLHKPGGEADGWHASLVEGYDFDKDCMIVKNSWGGETSEPRFDFDQFMAHDYYFVRVYCKDDNIDGKSPPKFTPRIQKFNGHWYGNRIDCAWMDKQTAVYTKNYLCEHHPEKDGDMNYLGYNINQWINLNLRRQPCMNEYYAKKIREKELQIKNGHVCKPVWRNVDEIDS